MMITATHLGRFLLVPLLTVLSVQFGFDAPSVLTCSLSLFSVPAYITSPTVGDKEH